MATIRKPTNLIYEFLGVIFGIAIFLVFLAAVNIMMWGIETVFTQAVLSVCEQNNC